MAVLQAGNAFVKSDQIFDDGVMTTKTSDQEHAGRHGICHGPTPLD